MTIASAWGRKRPSSNPAQPPTSSLNPISLPLSKKTKFAHVFDGTGPSSLDSTSTGHSKRSVKDQLKRRVATVKSMLGMGERCSDTSVQHNPDAMYSLTQGTQSAYMLANDSNMTTVHQPIFRLKPIPVVSGHEDDTDSISHLIRSGPVTPSSHAKPARDHNLSCSVDTSSCSQSSPGLQRRVSQKFRQAFGNGNSTVVKRSNMRSRPSAQTLALQSAAATISQLSSTPSTLNSGSFWSTPTNMSSPLTSATSTPQSVIHRGSMNSSDVERHMFPGEMRQLTPIPEVTNVPILTIKTVEAAATAKMHLELYFNSLFNVTSARALRRRDLERRLKEHHLPPDSQTRARKAWDKAETDNLRQSRVLKNTTNHNKAAEGIIPGGFEVISVLGKGSFGVVRLVKANGVRDEAGTSDARMIDKFPIPKPSRSSLKPAFLSRRRSSVQPRTDVYAMKVIRKSDMIRNGQEGHLRAERDFLVAAEGSKWIIPLIAAFQDEKHLYLVMEYCIGGDFLGLLMRKNILSEDTTKWYIAEMILCVEEAHRMRWIHRDVKPDNFLLAVDGHLKISDFGLAFDGQWSHDQRFYQKNRLMLLEELGLHIEGDELDKQEKQAQGHHADKTHLKEESMSKGDPAIGEPILDFRNRCQRRRMARSVVGTSQYMAPEVIRGQMYDGRCDWWSIAVIMYECLYGYTPFACEDRHQTKLKILQHKKTLTFPQPEGLPEPSIEALDLMMSMLVEKEKRLCSRQYDLNDYSRKIQGGRVEEEPISDIDTATTVDENAPTGGMDNDGAHARPGQTTELSQHFYEGQHIVPSAGLKLPPKQNAEEPAPPSYQNPLAQLRAGALPTTGATLVGTGGQAEPPPDYVATGTVQAKPQKREKKRPRDIILRDPVSGPPALETRRLGAFLGYEYRQPVMAKDIVGQALAEEFAKMKIKDYRMNGDGQDSDLSFERRVFMDSGGHMSLQQHRPMQQMLEHTLFG